MKYVFVRVCMMFVRYQQGFGGALNYPPRGKKG